VFDPFAVAKAEGNLKFDSLENVVAKSDFLIVTCALTPDNRHLVNASLLNLLNPGAYVINVSRGPLIDEAALVDSLERGHIAGAGLDVFENEPVTQSSPFQKMDNVIFGSHNGSNTIDAVRRASLKAIDILFTYLNCK
jgi:D-3-phosphoglycerate dehydrogenase